MSCLLLKGPKANNTMGPGAITANAEGAPHLSVNLLNREGKGGEKWGRTYNDRTGKIQKTDKTSHLGVRETRHFSKRKEGGAWSDMKNPRRGGKVK